MLDPKGPDAARKATALQFPGTWLDEMCQTFLRAYLASVQADPVADRETCKLYHSRWPTEDLLKAREPGGLITDDGEAWKYQYTHSDAQGGPYDLVYRPVATPPSAVVDDKMVEAAILEFAEASYALGRSHKYSQQPERDRAAEATKQLTDLSVKYRSALTVALAEREPVTPPAEADKARLSEALRGVVAASDEWNERQDKAAFDALSSAIDTARAALSGSGSGWRGMDSAPHNTEVLLATPPFECMGEQARWTFEVGMASWGERIGGYSNMSRDGYATHWTPLPAAPQQGRE